MQPLQQSTEQQIKYMKLLSVSTNMSPRHGSIESLHCSALAKWATMMTATQHKDTKYFDLHVRTMQGHWYAHEVLPGLGYVL